MTITAPSLFDARMDALPADHPEQVTIFDAIAEDEAERPEVTAETVAALFDGIWSGETNGFSEAKVRDALADAETMLDDLNAKRITPQRVVGRHIKRPMTHAREYLTNRIAECKRDLAAAGRTDSVNIANVLYRLPAGHPAKAHRVRFERSDKYANLFKLACECGQHESGYSAITAFTARRVERHIATGAAL